MIANAQKEGGTCAFVDAEHALDPSYARKLGVKVDDLLVSQPDTGEQALEIAEMLVRSNAIDVIVVDSVAALVPRAEIEGEMGDSFVGLQARLMSQALRKLTGAVHKSSTSLIFINQLREKIGVMFGSPETTAGGRALKFYASTRIDIRRIGKIKEGEEVIGSRTKATVVKNKLAPPFRVAEFDVMFNEGISYLGDLIDLASEHGDPRQVRDVARLRRRAAGAGPRPGAPVPVGQPRDREADPRGGHARARSRRRPSRPAAPPLRAGSPSRGGACATGDAELTESGRSTAASPERARRAPCRLRGNPWLPGQYPSPQPGV